MNPRMRSLPFTLFVVMLTAAGCAGRNGASGMPPAGTNVTAMSDSATTPDSVLRRLKKKMVIGSTIDPKFGQLNPYGLDVARSTAGKFTQGDLAVCNFNAKSNVQGTGFTIVALHPVPGSTPTLVYASKKVLEGCNALALSPSGDFIWAADFVANDNPIIDPTGKLVMNIKGKPLDRPFGQAFAQPKSGDTAFYESNAGDGKIIRFDVVKNTEQVVAKGFKINHGKPGSILGPSGLQYDSKKDTLYVVDGANNAVYALVNVTQIPDDCLTLENDAMHFTGCNAASARVVYSGKPLNGPISSALLYNGNLVIGNTLDPDGKNLMIELTPSGKVLDVKNVDKGAAGSLFGMVATGTTAADTKLYFNDDNHNNLQVLQP
ncbi:MAG TPA: hypothetical protein VKB39_01475 [Candidatus Baltobacteraceae bacterium]|nr:hypothetical protein [Candidatus Baltobacteraceae bacterium]